MKTTVILFLCALLAAPCFAVKVNRRGIPNKNVFGIEFSSGKAYYATVESVRSMSMQSYIAGNFRVNEINILTDSGSGMVRIYHAHVLSPEEAAELVQRAVDTAGLPGTIPSPTSLPGGAKLSDKLTEIGDSVTSDIVIKDYPVATHAHTIEFRVSSLSELEELYQQLTSHWLNKPDMVDTEETTTVDSTGAESTSRQRAPLTLSRVLFTVEG